MVAVGVEEVLLPLVVLLLVEFEDEVPVPPVKVHIWLKLSRPEEVSTISKAYMPLASVRSGM